MDLLKKMNDSHRKFVRDQRKRAQEQPFLLVLGVSLGQVANALILHRLGQRWGLPLKRRHWWYLIGVFGRDPGYPYNLIWQQPRHTVKAERLSPEAAQKIAQDFTESLRKALVARGVGPTSPPSPHVTRREPMPDTGA